MDKQQAKADINRQINMLITASREYGVAKALWELSPAYTPLGESANMSKAAAIVGYLRTEIGAQIDALIGSESPIKG